MKALRSIIPFLCATTLWISAIGASASGSPQGQDRVFRVINDTSSPVVHLYFENADEGNTGQDLLGFHNTLEVDHFLNFAVPGTFSCLFDIKAVLQDGRSMTQRNFDTCKETNWKIRDQMQDEMQP